MLDHLRSKGWDFSSLLNSTPIFNDTITLCSTSYSPSIAVKEGRRPSWMLNYPALSFLLSGKYHCDYSSVFSLMGIPHMTRQRWDKVVAWLEEHTTQLALESCQQVRQAIIDRGDQTNVKAAFDGFYLTRGHHSNNSSATMHDVVSDRIAWFTHRTKCGPGANWQGTSGGAEGDMMDELLKDAKRQGFTISQIIIDHDTSASTIATNHFPNVTITYCGNHTAKTFHGDLNKIKAIRCKVRKFISSISFMMSYLIV